MSDTLKTIARVDARKNRSGCPRNDDWDHGRPPGLPRFGLAYHHGNFQLPSTDTEAFRADEEGVDADVPVDAKNASTSDFENCRQFSTAPTPNLFFFKEERRTKNEERTTRNSAT
jgi:hypothetical protein